MSECVCVCERESVIVLRKLEEELERMMLKGTKIRVCVKVKDRNCVREK